VKEGTRLNLVIYVLDVRAQDTAGAHHQMSDIRISHHTFRQTDALAGSLNQGVWIFFEQLVVERHFGLGDRVAFTFRAIAKAVENDECEWSFSLIQNLSRRLEAYRPPFRAEKMGRAVARL
jgi:hypothetical protein